MQRSFSIIDDDDGDDEVLLPENSPKEPAIKKDEDNNESDLSLSEESSISPKRSGNNQKLSDLDSGSSRDNIFDLKSNRSAKETDNDLLSENEISILTKNHHFFSESGESDIDIDKSQISLNSNDPSTAFKSSKKITKDNKSYFLNDSEESDTEYNPLLNSRILQKCGSKESSKMSSPKVSPLNLDSGESQDEFESTLLQKEKLETENMTSPNLTNLSSGRQTAILRRRNITDSKISQILTDSDESENEDKKRLPIPGEFDPKEYENLEVDDEVKNLFQFILKYTPQQLELTYKFKPFIPEFLPAVGDIDAFLKVYPPETTINDKKCTDTFEHLGLTVLDEPATNQSDPAVLCLQLRAASGNARTKADDKVVVKKIDNVEKNSKTVEKWIKDISDLHKTKSSVVVRFTQSMPDLDDLMQQWPEEVEKELKQNGFPKPDNVSVEEYTANICNLFQIPLGKKKVQSLYLLFCLYAAIKQTQLYKTSTNENKGNASNAVASIEADQLVLE